ncbi:unnamed protein product [Trifolium pratense]|uniref:Uncharacterized protein n=1 Tax=Trifolium pratense TaxID=57577 RepID=A0ACB0IZ57_TRIPR|nr:unnamed protein product [Trifolium pratense]
MYQEISITLMNMVIICKRYDTQCCKNWIELAGLISSAVNRAKHQFGRTTNSELVSEIEQNNRLNQCEPQKLIL